MRHALTLSLWSWSATLAFVTTTLLVHEARAQRIEAIVAYVDEEPIFLSELIERLAKFGDPTATVETARREMLDLMIDDILIQQAARRLGLVVSDDDVARALEAIRLQNNLDDAGLDEALLAQHLDRAEYEIDLRRQLLRLRVLRREAASVTIAEVELRRVWTERVAAIPESERLSFAEARAALQLELSNARLLQAQERAMERLRASAYIARRIGGG